MMGSYHAEADLHNRWGYDNVVAWSMLDNAVSPTPAERVAEAIAQSEAHVNERFRNSRYTVPFSLGTQSAHVVKGWCATLSGAWLYRARGEDRGEDDKLVDMDEAVAAVEAEIDRVLVGMVDLDAERSYPRPSGPHD